MRRYSRSRVRETTYTAAYEDIGETWTGSRGKAKAAAQFQRDGILPHVLNQFSVHARKPRLTYRNAG
jgi:hypothetical protein